MEFAYFDGDDIGTLLELLLLENKISEASSYSNAISTAMKELTSNLNSTPDVEILFGGGDDLLAKWPRGTVSFYGIEKLRSEFFGLCFRTISVGVGASTSEAMINLRIAKLSGKNRTIAPTVKK